MFSNTPPSAAHAQLGSQLLELMLRPEYSNLLELDFESNGSAPANPEVQPINLEERACETKVLQLSFKKCQTPVKGAFVASR